MNVHLERLENVQNRIAKACSAVGRDPSEISLLAVSKTHPASALRELHALGQHRFGENRLQEALPKLAQLADLNLEWHFIGAVQSNKTREIASHFDWVQSVDREKILLRLAAHRPAEMPPLNICLQVNIDREPQKAGLSPEAVPEMAALAGKAGRLRLRGLMCLPRLSSDPDALAGSFRAMQELYAALRATGHSLDTLSMGMSGDLEVAIGNGSTMLRVGTDLFGPRGS
jgi:pyridoxal phosphate enzyme (YggS family)